MCTHQLYFQRLCDQMSCEFSNIIQETLVGELDNWELQMMAFTRLVHVPIVVLGQHEQRKKERKCSSLAQCTKNHTQLHTLFVVPGTAFLKKNVRHLVKTNATFALLRDNESKDLQKCVPPQKVAFLLEVDELEEENVEEEPDVEEEGGADQIEKKIKNTKLGKNKSFEAWIHRLFIGFQDFFL
eukprot:Lithocolla_globosa_v1_NODE_95_length_6502_cov_31.661238.p4 type:complete len:184 gc:universal NODE_95_length_6502_cov_31.661238:593-1144(+)